MTSEGEDKTSPSLVIIIILHALTLLVMMAGATTPASLIGLLSLVMIY